jgi:hypothetical protein
MKKKLQSIRTGLISLVFLVILSACASAVSADPGQTLTVTASNQGQLPTVTPENTTKTTDQKEEVASTPTPDIRPLPDDWKNWSVIPEVSNRAKEIAAVGREKGVNQRAFSKIGDCQNVSEAFMGLYDRQYFFLPEENQAYRETIDNFKGFFFRDSEAFGQGLNTAAALSPFHANPDVCLPNEGPVQCELRIVNPAYAFIRFERWYPDVTPPEEYEKYLRQVIDLVIENGTVPILMTKADDVERGHKINAIIVKLAYEYDIPLFNWWKAAQALPNRGMDPERNDGFHIDPNYGWTGQTLNGLGTLDAVWKATRGY